MEAAAAAAVVTKIESPADMEQLAAQANEKILIGEKLYETLENFKDTPGAPKIQRKITQEIKFLQREMANTTLKPIHVQSSNLTHYEFMVEILKQQRDVVHVDCGFALNDRKDALRVDIVCENGLKWIKVIVRNPKSLAEIANGDARFGAKSILDQAQEFIEASKQHLCMFVPPKVIFYFSQLIDTALLDALEAIGIQTASPKQPAQVGDTAGVSNVSTLNLDITTLLGYVSALSNGSCNWTFREKLLTEQAERERQTPLKPVLDKLFAGKRLVCCETAHNAFQDIMTLLAGPKEHERSIELMKRVEILPDVDEIPEKMAAIELKGRINERSLRIFAFGMKMRALTVTSNKAFTSSAQMQGINIPVFSHQARALTELKEATATPIA